MKGVAWHGYHSPVFHNNDDCGAGDRIATYRRTMGRGGRSICSHCAHLNTDDPFARATPIAPRPLIVRIPMRQRLSI